MGERGEGTGEGEAGEGLRKGGKREGSIVRRENRGGGLEAWIHLLS